MRHNYIETFVGAIVMIVAGWFFWSIYSNSNQAGIEGYKIIAQFDRIDGIIVGSDVKMSGVKIGVVNKLEINPKTYMAKATMVIKKEIELPVDSSAEIASESLLGGKYVAIVAGGSDEKIQENGQIQYTQSSLSFESMIGKFLFSQSEGNKSKSGK